MNPQAFEAVVSTDRGVAYVEMTGDVDGAAEDQLAAASGQVGDDVAEIVLDFRQVGYINSTGIALIVQLLSRARIGGQRVSAVNLSPHYRHIFEITRLADFMAIKDTPGVASSVTTG